MKIQEFLNFFFLQFRPVFRDPITPEIEQLSKKLENHEFTHSHFFDQVSDFLCKNFFYIIHRLVPFSRKKKTRKILKPFPQKNCHASSSHDHLFHSPRAQVTGQMQLNIPFKSDISFPGNKSYFISNSAESSASPNYNV